MVCVGANKYEARRTRRVSNGQLRRFGEAETELVLSWNDDNGFLCYRCIAAKARQQRRNEGERHFFLHYSLHQLKHPFASTATADGGMIEDVIEQRGWHLVRKSGHGTEDVLRTYLAFGKRSFLCRRARLDDIHPIKGAGVYSTKLFSSPANDWVLCYHSFGL